MTFDGVIEYARLRQYYACSLSQSLLYKLVLHTRTHLNVSTYALSQHRISSAYGETPTQVLPTQVHRPDPGHR